MAIFKRLDDAAYFAAQSMETTLFLVTSSFNSHFIRPVNSGQLTADGKIIETTNTQCIADNFLVSYPMDTVCPPGPLFGNAKWRNNCSFYLDSKGPEENARKPTAIKRPSLINLGLKSRPHLVTVRSMISPPPSFVNQIKP